MATFQEHMTADFARALTESGRSVVIDGGDPVLVFIGPVETMPGEFERQILTKMKIFHLPGTVAGKVPGQLVEVDGVRWEVLDHSAAGVSVCLNLMRSSG